MKGRQAQSGFALVETVVVVFIFGVVMSVFGEAFIDGLNIQRRSFAIQQLEENASFLLESVAKELRVGQLSSGDSDCLASSLSFTHPDFGPVTYSLSGTDVVRTANGVPGTVSSNQVEFTRLRFCVSGSGTGDQKQPRVTILAGIRSKSLPEQELHIQTTLSQRVLNN